MAEWLVALEASPGRGDGGLSDVAHQLHAVGEIRPEPSTGRYSLLVRRHEPDPADALQSAIADWQEARARSGQHDSRLVAARVVVVPSEAAQPLGAQSSTRRRAWLSGLGGVLTRPAAIAGAALVLVLVAVVIAGVGASREGARRPSVAVPVASQNLLTQGSVESPADFVRQFHQWGGAHSTFVNHPVADGRRADRINVAANQSGGVWAEAPVQPGSTYEEAAAIQVVDLAEASRLEMTLEWYDGGHQLVGYRMLGVPSGDGDLVRRVQQAVAPAGAVTARVAINMTHGGDYVVDDVRLQPVPSPAH